MLILDTNVISEVLRQAPDAAVVSWFEAQSRQQLFTTAVTQAEILYGISVLPKGTRRQNLLSIAQAIFDEDFQDRITFGLLDSIKGLDIILPMVDIDLAY